MILDIDVHSGVPIYRQIMDQVHRLIMTGKMPEGSQLEQVRSLAKRLKINPMTVSKAYSFLEQEGLVTRRRGVGLFVAHVDDGAKERIMRQMLERAMDQAAAVAVEMDVSLEESRHQFEKHFTKYRSQSEGGKGNER